MSIYIYNLVTDTFIICAIIRKRDKEGEGERDGWLIPSWKKILFYFSFYMKCTFLLLWDVASNPGTDFIIHHPVPHNRQLFLPEGEPGYDAGVLSPLTWVWVGVHLPGHRMHPALSQHHQVFSTLEELSSDRAVPTLPLIPTAPGNSGSGRDCLLTHRCFLVYMAMCI